MTPIRMATERPSEKAESLSVLWLHIKPCAVGPLASRSWRLYIIVYLKQMGQWNMEPVLMLCAKATIYQEGRRAGRGHWDTLGLGPNRK